MNAVIYHRFLENHIANPSQFTLLNSWQFLSIESYNVLMMQLYSYDYSLCNPSPSTNQALIIIISYIHFLPRLIKGMDSCASQQHKVDIQPMAFILGPLVKS